MGTEIPQPPGAWPLIGSIGNILFGGNASLDKLADTYGTDKFCQLTQNQALNISRSHFQTPGTRQARKSYCMLCRHLEFYLRRENLCEESDSRGTFTSSKRYGRWPVYSSAWRGKLGTCSQNSPSRFWTSGNKENV